MEKDFTKTIDAFFKDNNPKGAEEYMLSVCKMAQDTGDLQLELTSLNELIGYYRQTSEKEKLISVIEDTFSVLEKMGDTTSIQYATVVLNAANGYRSIGELVKARRNYEIAEKVYAKQISEGTLGADDLLIAGLHNNMSLLCQEEKNYIEAEKHLLVALRIVEGKKATFQTAVTYANLANTCVLSEEYDKAKDYARTSIRLFKARGLQDPHYCAALSALAVCYFDEGEYGRALSIFEEAIKIVENKIGKNSQYERMLSYVEECRERLAGGGKQKVDEPTVINGLYLSKKYYEEYGRQMIHEKFPEYEDKIAVGLVGEGSDCYGFDDALSVDHDYGPDFCMWLTDEVYDEIGEGLREEYDKLPKSFMGYDRTVTATGVGRRGVLKISDFYKKFLNTDMYEKIDYSSVPDYALSAACNGVVFRDDEGVFSAMREKLLMGYPERAKLLKIAEAAAGFSQCAQYNYLRMLKREDELTAQLMLSDGIKHALRLYHFLHDKYLVHDKWLYKSAGRICKGNCIDEETMAQDEFIVLLDKVSAQLLVKNDKSEVSYAVEELATYFVREMYERNIISDIEPYLDYHTEEILFRAGLCDLSDEELVDKIVKLEFKAFDKVKNEGGRAYCQNDWPTFYVMRKSQYLTWNRVMLTQYCYDFTREYNLGHNLITEKYGRMMESTDEARWNEIKDNFPELSDEKKAIIEQIVGIQMIMMEEFSREHPKLAGNARNLHSYEDTTWNTSYETYLRGEISTYSDRMLQLYGQYVVEAYKNGVNIAYITMENTAKLYGFKSLEEFEKI